MTILRSVWFQTGRPARICGLKRLRGLWKAGILSEEEWVRVRGSFLAGPFVLSGLAGRALEMAMARWISLAGGVLAAAICVASSGVQAQDKVTFDDHIKPIFRDRCLTCHNTNKKSSDLDLSSYTTLMQGGASGKSIEPGDSGASYLFGLVAHTSEPYMPPNADRIPDAEVELLKKWIDAGAPETSSSKVTIKKNNAAMSVNVSAGARPDGPAPLPDVLNLQPVVKTTANNAVSAIATNPWSKLVAVAGQKQVVLYHSETMEALGVLPFPEGRPRVLKFSRNGSLLLAGGGRGAAKGLCVVWDVRTGERIMSVGDELDEVLAADISADQTLIALGGPQKIVRVYSTATGELAYECKKHTDWIYSLEFSPDGVLLGTADRSGGLLVWEAHTGREYLTLTGHTAAVYAVTWRIDGNVLGSGSEDGTIRLWEMENGGQIKQWAAHGGGVFSVEFCRDGRVVSSGRDRVAKLWDANGNAVRSFEAFNDLALQVSHCDETDRVIAGDWTGEIRVWAAADGARVGNLTANPPTLEERIVAAEALAAPAGEKVKAAAAERDVAVAAQKAQQAKVDAAAAVYAAAEKKKADQTALVAAEEQKLVAQQGIEKDLTAKVAALQKAVPELKSAAAKTAEALALTPADEELKKVAEQLKVQSTAREEELKAKDGELATAKAEVVKLTASVDAQKKQFAADEQAVVAAKGVVDAETTALAPFVKTAGEKEQAVAVAQAEVTRVAGLVERWKNYVSLRDELAALETVRKARDAAQLASLEVQAELDGMQQQMAAASKQVEESNAAMVAMEKKVADVTASMVAADGQLVAQKDLMTKTQNAVPALKAALEQAQAALAALPGNAEIKASVDNLAAVADRQEKSLPGMAEKVAEMTKQMEGMKAEIDAAGKSAAESKVAMAAADEKVKSLAAAMAPVAGKLKAMQEQLAAAEQAVAAAQGVVETRRQQLRPLLQLSAL